MIKIECNVKELYNTSDELANQDPLILEQITALDERVEQFILALNQFSPSSNIILLDEIPKEKTPEQKEKKIFWLNLNRRLDRELSYIQSLSGCSILLFGGIALMMQSVANPETLLSLRYALWSGATCIGTTLWRSFISPASPVQRTICNTDEKLKEEGNRASRAEATRDKIYDLVCDNKNNLSDEMQEELVEIMKSISLLRKENNRISTVIDKKINEIESNILNLLNQKNIKLISEQNDN